MWAYEAGVAVQCRRDVELAMITRQGSFFEKVQVQVQVHGG